MTYLYLDIETAPTDDPEIIAEITAGITPPKTITKAESLAAWEAETKPGLVAEAIGKTALNALYGRVCCIGWALGGEDVIADARTDKRALITGFFRDIAQERGNRLPVIVGHNVADFDIRFLRQRCIVLGITIPAWLPVDPKPWDRSVFDTMHAWGGPKGFVTLDKLCRALRIPGKGDFTGADVAAAFAAGKFDRIADYCADDVERVRQIHTRMMIASGEIAA